ncbi:hypothetical protein BH09SUM1_BH09SUM1_10900 [soil metagenome]
MVAKNQPLPTLYPLSVGSAALVQLHGASTKGFPELPMFTEKSDVFAPFAAATAGNLYVIYSPGPDGIFDFQPPLLQDALAQRNVDLLNPGTYDPTNGTMSAGDIFKTNIGRVEVDRTATKPGAH